MRKQEGRGEQHSWNGTHGDIVRLYEEEKGLMGVRSGTLGQGNLLGSCTFANIGTTCIIKKSIDDSKTRRGRDGNGRGCRRFVP